MLIVPRRQTLFVRFREAREGQVAIIFALALLPIISFIGASVDYSRANGIRTNIQYALDAAVLAGAANASSDWQSTALSVFNANLSAEAVSVGGPTFSKNNAQYLASVSASVPTTYLGVIGLNTMQVSASSAAASGAGSDNSCIFTLDTGQSAGDAGITLNGAPKLNLSNCSIRSNTSMRCNGHDGSALVSYAAGTASGCSNPKSSAAIPDVYASLAANIGKTCGMTTAGSTWSVGSVSPSGSAVIPVSKGAYTEYHVCGNLTLSGNGSLTGTSPASDKIIVIENGSLILANNANVSLTRATIVLTGTDAAVSSIQFPNGNGHAATLSLSPSSGSDSPWQGVSIYQDPALTNGVDESWGPGANINVDGLLYLPNADLTISGNAASGNSGCTKIVTRQFTTNGSVNLNFSQTASGCTSLRLKQYIGASAYLAG
jgi:Flp pilus assembly protein TadG